MKITFHMKSGATIPVVAEDIVIKKRDGNEIYSYELKGMARASDLFYLRLDDISAITTEE